MIVSDMEKREKLNENKMRKGKKNFEEKQFNFWPESLRYFYFRS